MCGTCGCSERADTVTMTDMTDGTRSLLRQPSAHDRAFGRDHRDDGDHGHHHGDDGHHHRRDRESRGARDPSLDVISLEQAVLAENDRIAERTRHWLKARGVLALNLVSSPGAGKTTLLERTIGELNGRAEIAVIEGDQMTANDATRIRDAGARAIQINTGAGCHLEADMVAEAVAALDPRPGSILMIENVGNLVCPAMFDLGERLKVAVVSTPEGDDKPLKYPHMFRAAEVVLVNKVDLAPYVDFDLPRCVENVRTVNPTASVLTLSARTGEGLAAWIELLMSLAKSESTAQA